MRTAATRAVAHALVLGLLAAGCAPGGGRGTTQDGPAVPAAEEGPAPTSTPPPWPWELAAVGEDVPASVPLDDIRPGGPPPDGIPPIDDPVFETDAGAAGWLEPKDPVLLLELGAEARAYPLAILTFHEIVNDVVDGKPVVVTYCPLCNSGLVFERTLDGEILDFGTSGRTVALEPRHVRPVLAGHIMYGLVTGIAFFALTRQEAREPVAVG